MRYIWMVYEGTTNVYLKKLCHTYALVRVICIVMNGRFQNLVLSEGKIEETKHGIIVGGRVRGGVEEFNKVMIKAAQEVMDSVEGKDYQVVKQINLHMLELYKIKFEREEILDGFLEQGINEKSGVTVQWFPNPQILSLKPIIKNYDLSYTSLYQSISQLISKA